MIALLYVDLGDRLYTDFRGILRPVRQGCRDG